MKEEKSMKRRWTAVMMTLIIALSILTGCGGGDTTNNTSDVKTRTVSDSKGTVEIPEQPQRIVDISGNSDILSVLGYTVIGTANSDAYDYTKFPTYLEETLKGAKILGYSMQDTMDVEGILELDPDLIILSNVQEKMYPQMQSIAPTILIQLEQLDWKEDIRSIAKVMDKEDMAEEWLKNYEAKAQTVGNQIKEKYGADTTYLALLASGGQLFVFDAAGIGQVMYDDMGLAKPNNMPQQDNISLPVISYEGLSNLDADYLFVIGTDSNMKTLKENSIYKNMTAVKNGHVVELPSSPYFNEGYSCIGRNLFVDEFPSLMEQAK